MQPQLQDDDSGAGSQLETADHEIEVYDGSNVDLAESFVESEVDSDFALELD